MTGVMMALGDFRFSMDTAAYNRIAYTAAYRWAKQDRVGRNPAAQFTGPDLQTIDLSGTIYPHFAGGLGQTRAMRTMAAQGTPLVLVSGRGKVIGRVVILEVTEEQTVFFDNGLPKRVDFTLRLQEYGEDAG